MLKYLFPKFASRKEYSSSSSSSSSSATLSIENNRIKDKSNRGPLTFIPNIFYINKVRKETLESITSYSEDNDDEQSFVIHSANVNRGKTLIHLESSEQQELRRRHQGQSILVTETQRDAGFLNKLTTSGENNSDHQETSELEKSIQDLGVKGEDEQESEEERFILFDQSNGKISSTSRKRTLFFFENVNEKKKQMNNRLSFFGWQQSTSFKDINMDDPSNMLCIGSGDSTQNTGSNGRSGTNPFFSTLNLPSNRPGQTITYLTEWKSWILSIPSKLYSWAISP